MNFFGRFVEYTKLPFEDIFALVSELVNHMILNMKRNVVLEAFQSHPDVGKGTSNRIDGPMV